MIPPAIGRTAITHGFSGALRSGTQGLAYLQGVSFLSVGNAAHFMCAGAADFPGFQVPPIRDEVNFLDWGEMRGHAHRLRGRR